MRAELEQLPGVFVRQIVLVHVRTDLSVAFGVRLDRFEFPAVSVAL
jgi:hypothetical protein